MSDLEQRITELWEARDDLASVMPEAEARAVVDEAINLLDRGDARVAELVDGEVVVHQWLKQAILLLFRLGKMETIELRSGRACTSRVVSVSVVCSSLRRPRR